MLIIRNLNLISVQSWTYLIKLVKTETARPRKFDKNFERHMLFEGLFVNPAFVLALT